MVRNKNEYNRSPVNCGHCKAFIRVKVKNVIISFHVLFELHSEPFHLARFHCACNLNIYFFFSSFNLALNMSKTTFVWKIEDHLMWKWTLLKCKHSIKVESKVAWIELLNAETHILRALHLHSITMDSLNSIKNVSNFCIILVREKGKEKNLIE